MPIVTLARAFSLIENIAQFFAALVAPVVRRMPIAAYVSGRIQRSNWRPRGWLDATEWSLSAATRPVCQASLQQRIRSWTAFRALNRPHLRVQTCPFDICQMDRKAGSRGIENGWFTRPDSRGFYGQDRG